MLEKSEYDPERLMPGYRVGEWEIDTTHSEVSFSVRHTMIWLRGRFLSVGGIIITPENPLDACVSATIDPSSFTSGLELRDDKIRNFQDFLWTEKYPTITYVSRKLSPSYEPYKFKLDGDLTVLGVTKSVPLALQYHGVGHYELYGTRIGFSATTEFDRRDFGMMTETPRVASSMRLPDDDRLLGWTLRVDLQIEAVLTTDRGRYKP